MDRLTERTAIGVLVKEDYGEKALKTLYSCNGGKPNPHYTNCDEGYCAMEKLAAYEDAEEHGLLLKLPCKVGDILWTNHRMQGWYFRSKDAPYRVQVAFIGVNDSEEMGGGLFNVCYENHGHMMQFNFSDIGKTVFLTKAEAEEALRRMEGER